MSAGLQFFLPQEYLDVIDNPASYNLPIKDVLTLPTDRSSFNYDLMQLFFLIAIHLGVGELDQGLPNVKATIIILPSTIGQGNDFNLIVPEIYRKYHETLMYFCQDLEFMKLLNLLCQIKIHNVNPIYIFSPILNESGFCESLMITDLSAKKCWSWEPNTDKEATEYLQFRTLFEQSDETIKEFKNKKLLTYYILNNLLVRFFEGYSMNNLFAPCKRYTVENIEIGKMLSTNDKFVRPLVLPYIILNFIKNLVDLDCEPQSCSDISGILSKTLSTRKEKHNFSLFGVDAIKMYNHFRLENKCFTDTSNIKFYPNDETTNDVKSSSNKKILHLEKNVKQFFKSGLCFNDSIVSTSFDSYYYHKPQLSANTGSHSTDSSKPFIHYNSVSNNFFQEISPSVITDQSVPCIDATVSSHIDAPVSSLDATAQPILVPAAEASFVGTFNIEETQQMLEEYFEDQLEIYKANNKLADGKVTYLLKELCNYETSKFIDILRCFFNGVMAKEKYGLSFEREILKMSDEGKDFVKNYRDWLLDNLNLSAENAEAFSRKRYLFYKGKNGSFKIVVTENDANDDDDYFLILNYNRDKAMSTGKLFFSSYKQLDIFFEMKNEYNGLSFLEQHRNITKYYRAKFDDRMILNFSADMIRFLTKSLASYDNSSNDDCLDGQRVKK